MMISILPPLAAADPLAGLLGSLGLSTDLLRFLGRLHPVLVHFPIALIVVAGVVELFRFRLRDGPSPAGFVCLAFGAAGALAAALSGWLNAALDPPAEALAGVLTQHRWLGVATAGLTCVLLLMALGQRLFRWRWAATPIRFGLVVAMLAVAFAGHLGGTLVYGPDYLFRARTTDVPESGEPADAAQADLFGRTVGPIFAAHCVRCHGPERQRNGVRLDAVEHLLAGGAASHAVVSGDAEASDLFRLVSLPADDPDRMPPEGDPLTAGEVETIRQWITAGIAGAAPTGN